MIASCGSTAAIGASMSSRPASSRWRRTPAAIILPLDAINETLLAELLQYSSYTTPSSRSTMTRPAPFNPARSRNEVTTGSSSARVVSRVAGGVVDDSDVAGDTIVSAVCRSRGRGDGVGDRGWCLLGGRCSVLASACRRSQEHDRDRHGGELLHKGGIWISWGGSRDFPKPTTTRYSRRHSSGIREVSVRLTWMDGAQTLSTVGIQVLGPMEVDAVRALEPRDRIALGVLVVWPRACRACRGVRGSALAGRTAIVVGQQIHICIGRLRQAIGVSADRDDVRRVSPQGRIEVTSTSSDSSVRSPTPERCGWTAKQSGLRRVRAGPIVVAGPPARRTRKMAVSLTEAARLEELRRTVEEEWLDARLGAGEHRDVAVVAPSYVDGSPCGSAGGGSSHSRSTECARDRQMLCDRSGEPDRHWSNSWV